MIASGWGQCFEFLLVFKTVGWVTRRAFGQLMKPCHLLPKVLLQKRWRKKSEEELTIKVHLENDH